MVLVVGSRSSLGAACDWVDNFYSFLDNRRCCENCQAINIASWCEWSARQVLALKVPVQVWMRRLNNYKMNLKASIADALRKWANWICPDSGLREISPFAPSMMSHSCRTHDVIKLSVNIKQRLSSGDDVHEIAERYIYPAIADKIGKQLLKDSGIEFTMAKEHDIYSWTGEIYVAYPR